MCIRDSIKLARTRLEHVQELTLAVENGEALPWADETFDVVTSTYMFHELPRNARRNVVREMFRVLKPGGLVVLEDSAQVSDSPQIANVLGDFPVQYHEPFYAEYLRDDLADLLAECGFRVASSEPHLVAKVVVATKPCPVVQSIRWGSRGTCSSWGSWGPGVSRPARSSAPTGASARRGRSATTPTGCASSTPS